ncbi:enoyl-CoA hydratase [Alicycliphilus denitrificans]|uniref:Enoyl-CoA hydratase/isomerase n=2 Tax=Alicycliphilus denitrificans TaxID=179636 RepID=F4G585_ALIDK|nr:enoyl-CoA hydratase [Alicycliphilus denitrificans]ADV01473.1 Enoyl-CoA hydratase/isomerase [Alicycliphilus denitrificans BC]AEB86431.1 Enoyl-CoA hydratase/isomerase [Alicycliphilus denitrificans K601]QKD45538.1 enoyl-CoA hydratase [Alicycliphilus denitrificans]GAO25030.1 enoyl-CoA hydratase [Alicycliphilus sp. B1]
MTDNALLTRREGAVLVLSNNNPGARNALTPGFYMGLTAALHTAACDTTIGAVVVTGEGGHFCSGGDLRQIIQRRELPLAERRLRLEGLHNLVRALRDCPKPVIMAVEGAAAGAGLSLALAGDMLVAAKNAQFSVAYVKVGLTPDGGATALLAEFVSRQVLTELCLTGERVSGERMHQLGVVNRLAEPGQALEQAIALAQQVAAGPELAMARIKHLCRVAPRNTLEQQLELEALYMPLSQETEESREGINAFLEKRAPDFAKLRGGRQG